eukprot:GHVR01046700.1.p1 GENE.GHVR01046700.1~~GHVR01046700.1.p1  ORF type:complete len:165 (+),score=3.36 GHVR01046700.1:43-537(+)
MRSSFIGKSKHAMSFAVLNPLLPGHCIVVLRKHVPHAYPHLETHAVGDVWILARNVCKALKTLYDTPSATFFSEVASGRSSGRTHIFLVVHVIPRQPGDLQQNDDIYKLLSQFHPMVPAAEMPSDSLSLRRGESIIGLCDTDCPAGEECSSAYSTAEAIRKLLV